MAAGMFLVFVRHGGVAVLLLGVAAEALAWLFGAVPLPPVMIVSTLATAWAAATVPLGCSAII
jgi:hypothetical protein